MAPVLQKPLTNTATEYTSPLNSPGIMTTPDDGSQSRQCERGLHCTMAHILVISHTPTHPVDAGNRARIATMLTTLRELGHTFVFVHAAREQGDQAAMRAAWGGSYIAADYHPPKATMNKRWRRLLQRLSPKFGHQYQLDEWYDPALDSVIETTIASQNFDAVLVEYVFFSKALLGVPDDLLKIIDTHDCFADRHKRFLAEGIAPKWFSCTEADENRGLQRADRIIAIQPTEAEEFRSRNIRGVHTVGHPVALARLTPEYPASKQVLAVGSRNSINTDSLRWFCQRVWPRIMAAHPDATLSIAGSVCADLTDADGVALLGQVDDLAALHEQAQVIINPMLTGTGLKIKTIEALGQGRALVSTPAGGSGILNPDALVIADGEENMVKAITELLSSPEACARLGKTAHEYAKGYNSECKQALDELFQPKK